MSELDPKGPYWRIKDGTKIEAPVVGVVELNKNSGKGDTLIVSGNWEFDGVGEVSVACKFDKNGRSFDTVGKVTGGAAVAILGLEVSASVEMSGDFLSITLPGNATPITYPRSSIEVDLASDLVARGFSVESASDVAQALTVAMDGIASIETELTQYVADIPYISDLSAKFETPSEIGSITYLSADAGDVQGTADFDYVNGGGGNDQISGGAGSDWLEGNGGSDQITGGADSDVLIGGSGIDQLFGGGADDFIFFDAEDTVVNGGAGRDVAVALGSDGVTVNMAEQGLECVIGCDGADTISVTEDGQPVFAAGGGGSDHFILDNLEAHAPRILWGGDGADVFEFQNGGGVSLAVVNIDGLTEEAFARLTLADLGLGEIDVSWLSAIIINPDAADRFYTDEGLLGTASVNLGDWSQLGDDPEFLSHLFPGFASPVSFGVRTSDVLGGSYAIQAVYDNEVRALHQTTFNYNFFDITVWSNGEYRVDETENYVEHWINDVDEAIDDALTSAELVFAQFDEDGYSWATSEYWTVQERSNLPTGPFMVVGGQFDGNSLLSNGDLTGSRPDDPGPSPFDWLLAA